MLEEEEIQESYYNLLQMFSDNPPKDNMETCPFGIHNICEEA